MLRNLKKWFGFPLATEYQKEVEKIIKEKIKELEMTEKKAPAKKAPAKKAPAKKAPAKKVVGGGKTNQVA